MIWVPLNGAATLVFLLGSKVSVNYSMAPPRDAVDQTVARPPVADGDPYSTPVPRHFASNSMGFFFPSQWHMNSMFFFFHLNGTCFFLHSPFLDDILLVPSWSYSFGKWDVVFCPPMEPQQIKRGGFQSFTVAGNGCGKEITSLIFSLGVGSRPFWERSGSIFDGKPGKTLWLQVMGDGSKSMISCTIWVINGSKYVTVCSGNDYPLSSCFRVPFGWVFVVGKVTNSAVSRKDCKDTVLLT